MALKRLVIEQHIQRIQRNLEHPVMLRVVDSFEQFPANVRADAYEKGIPGSAVKGVYANGEVIIDAQAIHSIDALEQSVHEELYGHYGFHQYYGDDNRKQMADLYQAIGGDEGFARLCKEYDVDLSPYTQALRDAPQQTRESILAEELLAHIASVRDDNVKTRLSAVYGGVRHWWRENGFTHLPLYNRADINALLNRAHKAARLGPQQSVGTPAQYLQRLANNPAGPKVDAALASSTDELTAWTLVSMDDEAFQLPRSDKKDLTDIFSEVDEPFTVYEAEELALQLELDPPPDTAWRIEAPDDDEGVLRAGVFQRGDEVWLDVSAFQRGGVGRHLYNAVANYAYNNNLKFLGDPTGLSDVAVSRRLENMLSSALKFGTTRHIQPHPRQLEGHNGVPPLDWKEGDDRHNLQQMLDASVASTVWQFPELDNLRYDVETGQFINSATGRIWNDERFEQLSAAKRGSLGRLAGSVDGVSGGPSRPEEITAGSTTLKRAVFTRTLSRGTSEERSAILDALSRQSSQSLNGILYSLSSDQRDWGKAPTRTEKPEPPTPTPDEPLVNGLTGEEFWTTDRQKETVQKFLASVKEAKSQGRSFDVRVFGLHDQVYISGTTAADQKLMVVEILPDGRQAKAQTQLGTFAFYDQTTTLLPQSEYLANLEAERETEALSQKRREQAMAPTWHEFKSGTSSPLVACRFKNRWYRLGEEGGLVAIGRKKTDGLLLLQLDNAHDPIRTYPLTVEELTHGSLDMARESATPATPADVEAHWKKRRQSGITPTRANIAEVPFEDLPDTISELVADAGEAYEAGDLERAEQLDAYTTALNERVDTELGARAKQASEPVAATVGQDASNDTTAQVSHLRDRFNAERLNSVEPTGKVTTQKEPRVMPANWADDYVHPVQGTLFQFAGYKAKTADTLALGAALQFEKEGRDPEAIRQKTGWFRGEDEQWRFEISDHDSTLQTDRLRPIGGTDLGFNGRLGEVLDHPRLYAAYPHLAQMPVSIAHSERLTKVGSYLSTYDNGTNLELPMITVQSNNLEKLHDTLLHEVQHAVQELEEFGQGSNPVGLRNDYIESLQGREEELQARLNHLTHTPDRSPFEERELNLIVEDLELIGRAAQLSASKQYTDAFFRRYQDFAGEREARMTAESKDLTPAQRAARSPFKASVQGAKPIVAFNGTPTREIASQVAITPKADLRLLPQASVMRLTPAADRTTFLHESAHVILDMEAKTSRGKEMDPLQRKIAHYLEVPNLQNLTRKDQETFARDYEQYLREQEIQSHRPTGMKAVMSTVKGWFQSTYDSADDLGRPLPPIAYEVFDEITREVPPRDFSQEKALERHEQRVAMELFNTDLFSRGECYTNAKMMCAYALAKVDRDPEYPTLDRVFEHMNLKVERAEVSDVQAEIRYDWNTFDLDSTMRRHQSEIQAAQEKSIEQYDISRLDEALEHSHLRDHDNDSAHRSLSMSV